MLRLWLGLCAFEFWSELRRAVAVSLPKGRADMPSFYAQTQGHARLAQAGLRSITRSDATLHAVGTLRRAPDPPRNTLEACAAARAAENKVQHQLPLTNPPGARP